jgi:hypothetical protein
VGRGIIAVAAVPKNKEGAPHQQTATSDWTRPVTDLGKPRSSSNSLGSGTEVTTDGEGTVVGSMDDIPHIVFKSPTLAPLIKIQLRIINVTYKTALGRIGFE